MFNLREFILKGLFDAIGKMHDYQIILNAAGWHEKGVLTEDDLQSIQNALVSIEQTEEEQENVLP